MVNSQFLIRELVVLAVVLPLFIFPNIIFAQCSTGSTSIEIENFETAYTGTGGWAMDYVSSAGDCSGTDLFGLTTGIGGITPIEGTQFWGTQDVQGTCGTPANVAGGESLTFTYTIPGGASYTEAEICFMYTAVAFDGTDHIYATVNVNGATPCDDTNIILIDGMNGGGVSAPWTQQCFIVSVLPADIVSLVILVDQNGNGDYSGFDSVSICEAAPGSTLTCAPAVCSVTNVTVMEDGNCSGDDATYTVCADVSTGSGDYDLVDTDNANAVLYSLTGQADGNICFPVIITGPTTATTLNVDVVDNADATCIGGSPQLVTLIDCPIPCIPPAVPMIDDINACDGESTEIIAASSTMNDLPFIETFDIAGEGVAGACTGPLPTDCVTNVPASNMQWMITGSTMGLTATTDFFITNSTGLLVAQDVDVEICFETVGIDITGSTSVEFSIDLLEGGDLEPADYVDVTYIVDGTPTLIEDWMSLGSATHTLIGEDTPNDLDWESTTVTASGISGTNLVIQVCVFNGAGSENYSLGNLMVSAPDATYNFYDANPVPGPANLLGTGNSYDPMTNGATSPETFYVTCVDPDTSCESAADEVVVTVTPNPTPSIVNPTICPGAMATLNPGMYASYAWDDTAMSTTQTITVGMGTYMVTVTDANGCTASTMAVVSEYTPPTPSLSDVSVCPGAMTTLDAGMFDSYAWDDPAMSTSQTITVGMGTYTVVVTDANGCTASTMAVVSEYTPPTPSLSDVSVCPGAMTTLDAGMFDSYAWDDPAMSTSQTITVGMGTYTVVVTDANGCTASTMAVVSEYTPPTPSLSDVSVCPGAMATLNAGMFDSYAWDDPAMSTSQTITVGMGTYTVVVTDANGCTASTMAVVSEYTPPTPSLSNVSVCQGAMTTLDAGMFDSYAWDDLAMSTSQTIIVGMGTYTVVVTDANGCTASSMATVSEYTPPAPNLMDGTVCMGGMATLNPGTFSLYLWGGGQTSPTITVGQGMYSVTVTDSNGCTASTMAMITESTNLSTNLIDEMVCPGDMITLDPGTFTSYLWGGGQTTPTLTVGIGMYSVTVTDGSGCTGTGEANITNFTSPTPSLSDESVCPGATTILDAGMFSNYSWDDPAMSTTQTITVGMGTYTVVVTDVNGCTASTMATVSEYASPTPSLSDESVCPGATTTLDAGMFSNYSWDDPAMSTTQTITVGMGTYTVVVTDVNGCMASTMATVSEYASPAPNLADESVCPGATTTLDAGMFSNYSWDDPAMSTTQTIMVGMGTYTVVVTDVNGCTASTMATVSEYASPTPSLSDESVCPGATTTLDAGMFSNYSWDDPAMSTTQTITVGMGTYTVVVTDANGCTASTMATVSEYASPTPSLTDESVCPGATTTLDAGIFSSYAWDDPAMSTTQTITVGMGIYTVVVTDINGCTASTMATVLEYSSPSPSIADVTVCPGATVILDAGSYTSYLWGDGETGQTITVGMGTYMVMVTDMNGCTGSTMATVSEYSAPGLDPLTVCEGETGSLIALGTPAASMPFVSSTTAIATVDDAGIVTGVLSGVTTITFTDINGCTAEAIVTVDPLPLPPIATDIAYCLGAPSLPLTATAQGGGTLTWYDVDPAMGGAPIAMAPTPATNVATTLNYWVTETTSCTSQPTMVTVVIRSLSNPVLTQTCVDASNYDLEICFDAINPGPSDMFTVTIDGVDSSFPYTGNAGVGADQYCVIVSNLDPTDMETGLIVTITDSDPTAAVVTVFQDVIIAATSFEEAIVGGQYTDTGDPAVDHDLINNLGESQVDFISTGGEIGFDATYLTTGSVGLTDGDFVGASNFLGDVVMYTDGAQGYQMSDTDGIMVTTFDPIDISACANVDISIDYFINGSGWETGDAFIISVDVDGTITDLINTTGVDIDLLMIEDSWTTLSQNVTGNLATVIVSLESNAGGEAIYIDNLIFDGNACMTASMASEMCSTTTTYDESGCFMCPTIGGLTALMDLCEGETFDLEATGITGVEMAFNLETDFGIEFVSFLSSTPPVDPYIGGTSLGVIPFSALTGGPTGPYTATLTGQTLASGNYQICAILEPDPMVEPGCNPVQCTSITINGVPPAPVVMDINVCEGESTEISILGGNGTLPFIETFDTAGEGIRGPCQSPFTCNIVPPSNGQWTVTGDFSGLIAFNDFFETGANSLDGQDLDAEVCFETVVIDISGYSDVSFAIDVNESGDHEVGDYVDVNYIVDGTSTTIINWMSAGSATHTLVGDVLLGGVSEDGDWDSANVTQSGISGSSLVIQVCLLNDAGAEIIRLDNLMVTASESTYNFYDADPATGNLLAGNTNSFDPATTVAESPEIIYVTCVDPNTGCEGPAEMVTITVNPEVVTTCTNTPVSCNLGADGTATVTVTGGTPMFSYLWSSGGTAATETGLTAGTYMVTVTDMAGCSSTCETTISEPTLLTASCIGDDLLCNTDMNGSVSVVASGGTPVYTYAWSSGGTSAIESGLGVGTYTVIVTDANGCTTSCEAVVTEPSLLTTVCTTDDLLCNGDMDGEATVIGTGGSGPYSYLWSSGGITDTEVGLIAGTYTVVVTDTNGCTSSCEAVIAEPTLLTASCTNGEILCGGDIDGVISVAAVGGTGVYTYAWSSGGTTDTETGLGAGFYTVVVTDANGCTATCEAEVVMLNDSSPPVFNYCQPFPFFYGLQTDGTISIPTSDYYFGATDNCSDPANIVLSGAVNDFGCADVGPNIITLTITDQGGNTATCNVEIVIIDAEPPTLTCPSSSGNLIPNGDFDTGDYSSWSFVFGNAFIEPFQGFPTIPTSKLFGPFSSPFGASGYGQNVPCTGGDWLCLSGNMLTPGGDDITGTSNFVELKLEFFDAAGNIINGPFGTPVGVMDGSVPVWTWIPYSGCLQAPPGTVSVNAVVVFVQPNFEGGAVFVDNLNLEKLTPITFDVNLTDCTSDVVFTNNPNPTDACGIASFTNSYNGTADLSGNYPFGETLVTYTAIDNNGNVSECSVVIEVIDPTIPTFTPMLVSECSMIGLNVDINGFIDNGVMGASYTWTAADNPNVTGETLTGGSGNLIADVLINTSGNAEIVTYTITPSSGSGCPAESFDLMVEVYSEIVAEISCGCGYNLDGTSIVPVVNISGLGGGVPTTDGSSYTLSSAEGTFDSETVNLAGSANLFLTDAMGGSYSITITDEAGCEITLIDICSDCSFSEEFMFTDPCACNGDQSGNGAMDGTFQETVQILGPAGFNLVIGAGSIGLIGLDVGDPFTEITPGVYQLVFNHLDNVGYTVFADLVLPTGATTPVLDAAGQPLMGVNACQYPILDDPMIGQTDFCQTDGPIALGGATSEIQGHPGNITITVNGFEVTEFNPAEWGPGMHNIQWFFTGDFVSNIDGTMADPAIPGGTGCGTRVSQLVNVHSGGQLTCNDHINVSLDADCSLGVITADMFMEGASQDQFFGFEILGVNDLPIELNNENDPNYISNYLGQTLTYQVYDVCTGNSCWGTISLEDKIAPTPNCDCETPYLVDGVTPNPDCTFRCFDVWDLEILEDLGKRNNELLPSIDDNIPDDNCMELIPSVVNLDFLPGVNCGEEIVQRSITFEYLDYDGSTQTIECVQQFLFAAIDPSSTGLTENGAWDGYENIFVANAGDEAQFNMYTPEPVVILPCGSGIDPAAIAEYYDLDTPGRPVGKDRDDHDDTPNIIEHNEGVPYAYPYVVIKGWSNRYHAKPIDNNICNMYAVYSDLSYDTCAEGCYGNSKVARSWTLLDWCDASVSEFVQTIKRVDTEGPTISGPDQVVSVDPWGCTVNYEVPYPEHLHDNCDSNPSWSVIGPTGITITDGVALGLEKGTTTLTYVSEDCCGNLNYSPFKVTVVDDTPPVVIVKENIVVQLTNLQAEDGYAKLFAKDIDNFSHDGCSDVHFEVRRPDDVGEWCSLGSSTFNNDGHPGDHPGDPDGGEYVMFCCEDVLDIDQETGVAFSIVQVILRVWDDGDMDGVYGSVGDNYNESWVNVRVEDKLDPVVICPPTAELSCDQDYLDYDLTGRPYASKTCNEFACDEEPSDRFKKKPANSAPFIGEEIPAYNPSCRRGAIERTWNCGDYECTQWIVMRDTEDGPLDIIWPLDQTVNCLDTDAGEPSVVERVCELVGVNLESDTFNFEDGACYKILNHWTVINWCDYDAADSDLNENIDATDDGLVPGYYQHTQVIKLIDTEKPILSVQDTCFAANTECVGTGLALWAGASDNGVCGSAWLKWEVEIDMWADWEVDYTFSSYLASDEDYYVAPSSGDIHINLPDNLPMGCASSHRVLWKVSDGCGNVTSRTSFFTIEDKKKPTPYMLNLSTALMENGQVELWARDFDAGSFDNCTDQGYLSYTFSSTVPPQLLDSTEEDPWYDIDGVAKESDYENGEAEEWNATSLSSARIFDLDDLAIAESNGGLLPIEVYVWDQCGNFDYAVVNLKLISNEGGSPRANLSGQILTAKGDGIELVNVEINSEQVGYPSSLSTDDSGSYLFEYNPMYESYSLSGEKNDGWLNGVTTLDLVLIQRHILGLAELEGPYNLIAADANNDDKVSAVDLIQLRKLILGVYDELPYNNSWRFLNKSVPMNESNPWPFTEMIEINDLEEEQQGLDFVGVKIGDVNGSVTASLTNGTVESRDNKEPLLLQIDERIEGEETIIEFRSPNFIKVGGFQLALMGEVKSIIEVQKGALDLGAEHLALVDGNLGISFPSKLNLTVDAQETLFAVRLKKEKGTNFRLTNTLLRSEAYVGNDLDEISIELISEDQLQNVLLQNEPNPWTSSTKIEFVLERKDQVVISLYNVEGQLLHTHTQIFGKGLQSYLVTRSMINGLSGLIYYKLETGSFSSTRKMISIE